MGKSNLTLWQFMRSLWRILVGHPQIPASVSGNKSLQLILNRRSVRRFKQSAIPEDAFNAILEAGRLAPSTVNLQTWSFVSLSAGDWRELFGRSMPFQAQRGVIVLGDVHRNRAVIQAFPHSPLVEYTIAVMNASLAAMNMNLAAEALGISSVMLSETGRTGLLDAGYLASKLRLPAGVFPILTIVFGYASGARPPMPPKLPLDQICFSGAYCESEVQVLQDWISQMAAGYKATHLSSSLDAQLNVYKSKIDQAEHDLHRLIFGNKSQVDSTDFV